WESGQDVSGPVASVGALDVTGSGSGFAVAWGEPGAPRASSTVDGAFWTPPATLSPPATSFQGLSAAPRPSGVGFTVAFGVGPTAGGFVVVVADSADGVTWTASVVSDPDSQSGTPALATSGDNQVVTWMAVQAVPTTEFLIAAATRVDGGA